MCGVRCALIGFTSSEKCMDLCTYGLGESSLNMKVSLGRSEKRSFMSIPLTHTHMCTHIHTIHSERVWSFQA